MLSKRLSTLSTESSSSTATADSEETGESTTRTGKSVHFNLQRNQLLTFEPDYEGIIDQIWWSGDDYIRIKAKSREESRAWRREGYGVLVKESFETPRPDIQEYLPPIELYIQRLYSFLLLFSAMSHSSRGGRTALFRNQWGICHSRGRRRSGFGLDRLARH
jgi:hypothetical protein